MAEDYVDPDFVVEDYVEGAEAPPVPGAGALLSFTGSSGRRRGGTMLKAPDALHLPHMEPRPAAGDEIFLAFYNWHGLRIFGFDVISDQIIADDVGREHGRLLAVDPIDIGGAPVGDILGRVGLSERSLGRVTVDNLDGYWSMLLAREAVLAQPMGLFLWPYGSSRTYPLLTGVVERGRLKKRRTVIEFGPG